MIQINLGSISKNTKGIKQYQVYFTNPIDKKSTYLGVFISKENAENHLNNYLLDFYYKNSFLLPKGVFVSKAIDSFGYEVQINKKNYRVFYSKILKEVIDERIDFINNLLF
jgi:predicted RecB family nuclease